MIVKIEAFERGSQKVIVIYDHHKDIKNPTLRLEETEQTEIVINNIKQLLSEGWDLCGEFPHVKIGASHAYPLEQFFKGGIKKLPTLEKGSIFQVCLVEEMIKVLN
jgi:hypothetical protein